MVPLLPSVCTGVCVYPAVAGSINSETPEPAAGAVLISMRSSFVRAARSSWNKKRHVVSLYSRGPLVLRGTNIPALSAVFAIHSLGQSRPIITHTLMAVTLLSKYCRAWFMPSRRPPHSCSRSWKGMEAATESHLPYVGKILYVNSVLALPILILIPTTHHRELTSTLRWRGCG